MTTGNGGTGIPAMSTSFGGHSAFGYTYFSDGTSDTSSFMTSRIRDERRNLFGTPNDSATPVLHIRGDLGSSSAPGGAVGGGPPVFFGPGPGVGVLGGIPEGPQPLLGAPNTYAPLGNSGDLGGGLGGGLESLG